MTGPAADQFPSLSWARFRYWNNSVDYRNMNTGIGQEKFALRSERRVVVLDDEPSMVELLTATLESKGCAVTSNARKDEFLRLVREQRQPVPELIITDIMSAGMNGLDLLRALKCDEKLRHIPVIVASGYASSCKEEVLRLGAYACLSKPFKWSDLMRLIEEATLPLTSTSFQETRAENPGHWLGTRTTAHAPHEVLREDKKTATKSQTMRSKSNRESLRQVAAWLAVIPGAVVAAILTILVTNIIGDVKGLGGGTWFGIEVRSEDPNDEISRGLGFHLLKYIIQPGLIAGVFVYVARAIAPTHKQLVGWLFAGITAAVTLWFYTLLDRMTGGHLGFWNWLAVISYPIGGFLGVRSKLEHSL